MLLEKLIIFNAYTFYGIIYQLFEEDIRLIAKKQHSFVFEIQFYNTKFNFKE